MIIGSRFSIKPNYIVRSNVWHSPKDSKRFVGRKTDVNLKDNKHNGFMSPMSEKKIRSAINWLCASAKQKWVPETEEHKGFYFKVNFITLSLPALGTHITHENIFKELLAPFLDYGRKAWLLNNYVWKIELQQNGNPHVHLTTDTYIHWKKLRNRWNKQLSDLGIVDLYTSKHTGCKFEQYLAWNPANELSSVAKRYEQWQYGNSIAWSSPNSTDVHAVKNINDVAAYVSKYMAKGLIDISKNPDLVSGVVIKSSARMWSCSKELSQAFNTSVEILGDGEGTGAECMFTKDMPSKQIHGNPDKYGIRHVVCDVWYVSWHTWATKIKGDIRKAYDDVRLGLQQAYRATVAPVQKLAYI